MKNNKTQEDNTNANICVYIFMYNNKYNTYICLYRWRRNDESANVVSHRDLAGLARHTMLG